MFIEVTTDKKFTKLMKIYKMYNKNLFFLFSNATLSSNNPLRIQ